MSRLMRLAATAFMLSLLSGCAGDLRDDLALIRCALVDHDPNRRCT